MNNLTVVALALVAFLASLLNAAPQNSETQKVLKYSPFNYEYKVEDAEKKLYHDKTETGDENGKVIGRYSVLMPDGRLMVVEYLASLETGFVPKISFVDNVNPFTG